MANDEIPGLDAINGWLAGKAVLGLGTATAISRFAGGASNITCKVELEGGDAPAVVFRVQRERGIFEPYDVLREGRVLDCLGATNVPVPRLIASEASNGVLGAPFIVLEWVDAPHMGEAGSEANYAAFVAAVAAIHSAPWEAAGLHFLGAPESVEAALEAELEAIEVRRARFAPHNAILATARERLAQTIPSDGTIALCQGDINVFNYLFRAGEVVAVVDWEQARLSDPRSDIGQLLALSHLKGSRFGAAGDAPFAQAYQAASGCELRQLEWFRARWFWELGVIYHGWVAFNGSQPWYDWDELVSLLERALDEL